MTKKVKHQTDKFGALEFKKLKQGSIEWCDRSHARYSTRQKKNTANKNASHVVYIIGIPTAFVCSACKKEWVKLWKECSPIEYV